MAMRRVRVVLSLCFGILITIGGCAEHPSSPVDSGPQPQQVQLSVGTLSSAETSSVIGPEGGTLSIPGGHQLVFPAGALSAPTQITARPGKVFIEVEFGPHGLQFPAGHEPVLTLSYDDALNVVDESSLVIAYVQGNRITEVLAGTVDTQEKTVSAKLGHFSKYVLGSN